MTIVGLVLMQNKKNLQINHVHGLKAQLEEWLTIMSEDPLFAPPAWVMESMWTRLDLIEKLLQD